ncbi:hypothetical protein KPH14_012368 [Odynerus spinipes]|uniref:Uncharacterized protein n=1 Tax=Odynerus spinipes TaxID=1348599 RepID=A0AAD9RI00_9HYME|nr:hypothetical protein KPH14_012368 [Odynerus spinipes]
MKFRGFHLLLFSILCIAVAASRSIGCNTNTFLNSKSIACRSDYGGTYMQPWAGGGGNAGTSTNGSGNEAGGGGTADGATGAMSAMANMAPAMMRTAQQAMGTIMDAMSNMNPMG